MSGLADYAKYLPNIMSVTRSIEKERGERKMLMGLKIKGLELGPLRFKTQGISIGQIITHVLNIILAVNTLFV